MSDEEIENMLAMIDAKYRKFGCPVSLKTFLDEGLKPYLKELQKYVNAENAFSDTEKSVRERQLTLWQMYQQQLIEIAELKVRLGDE